jgi:hypothetical protein
VLARRSPISGVHAWTPERRVRDGLTLSDHTPIEARVG